ncbi:uncharacterized protein CTRU02_208001 [Colletotrichum truncatum]|uniref:Uncharacterized protein n=1 Tax=Colletotrichum truncatum TaxID=5467 RepID=A0ACC3YV86_COLTU
MFKPSQSRGVSLPRARPKTILFLILAAACVHFFMTHYGGAENSNVLWRHGRTSPIPEQPNSQPLSTSIEPLNTENQREHEFKEPNDDEEWQRQQDVMQKEEEEKKRKTEEEEETRKKKVEEQKRRKQEEENRKKKQEEDQKRKLEQDQKRKKEIEEEERSKHEQNLRDEFAKEYETAKTLPGSNAIYGNTLNSLVDKESRTAEHATRLQESSTEEKPYANHRPVHFNPYPDYNSDDWNQTHRAPYVPCVGANGDPVEDLLVFKGHPTKFPKPAFGGFEVLNMDGNLCYERDTRLGSYGFLPQLNKHGLPIVWDDVNWGDLQKQCVERNSARFDKGKPNRYISTAYADIAEKYGNGFKKEKTQIAARGASDEASDKPETEKSATPDSRTAVLLRTYTGKTYTENDKQVIRSLISELSLRSGGEYQVFLLLHVRDASIDIWNDKKAYQGVLDTHIPREFHGITKLWNDQAVWDTYEALTDDDSKTVHYAQWLSVQKFSLEHPEYEYIWNWEMDVRVIGHNYDFLRRIEDFSRKQPRRGLWERNERYYIPQYHGAYDTDFRESVEHLTRGKQVWGPPKLSFINPVGPKPPVSNPEEDPYEWGVGEDADIITFGPIFDPIDSGWIFSDKIWGYKDDQHPDPAKTLPRRNTIVTQSRLSKRLLDIMHIENLRGNHIASEMTPQTVALLHGFKAVFAPHPTWFDRPWTGTFLAKWFNPGPRGASGGNGSPMGYGRERRYQGITWYYRAEPPPRLYNNWMGYVDTGIGGKQWEIEHGRPCLPPMILHPIKDVGPTERGFASKFELFYG